MHKAHVQIPDELYREAKAVADAHEWTFAEVVRRGLEWITWTRRAAIGADPDEEWEFPVIRGRGTGLSAEELCEVIEDEREYDTLRTLPEFRVAEREG